MLGLTVTVEFPSARSPKPVAYGPPLDAHQPNASGGGDPHGIDRSLGGGIDHL